MDLRNRNRVTDILRGIEIAWDKIRTGGKEYSENLDKWRSCRRRTLLALLKFQDKFDKIHLYSSATRAVGNGASLLGSLVTIVGFGLSFSKDLKPIGQELMKYGPTVGVLGGATTLTTSLAECGFNASVLNEFKATLEEDRRQTEKLIGWFNRTKQFDSYLQEVFGCGVLKMDDIFTAIREVSVIYSKGGKALEDIQYYLSELLTKKFSVNSLPNLDNKELEKILCNASSKVKELLLEFCNNSAVRRSTLRIYDSFKKNPLAFEMSKISIRLVRKAAVQEIAFLSHFSSIDGQSLMHCVDLTARGIFGTISVAMSVFALLSSVNDIKNGKSKYSEMVESVHSYLLMELETVKSSPILKRSMLE